MMATALVVGGVFRLFSGEQPQQVAPAVVITAPESPANMSLTVQLPAWAFCPAPSCPFSKLTKGGVDALVRR